VIAGPIVTIYSRFRFMNFLHGFMDGTAAIVIQNPKQKSDNIRAIAKPFQIWVYPSIPISEWIYLLYDETS